MNTSVRKILILSDSSYKPIKMYLDQMPKLAKGLMRLGHDARMISYAGIVNALSPFKSKTLSQWLYKKKTDEVIARYAQNYQPDYVYIGFARSMDAGTIEMLRDAVPRVKIIGLDGDPWPKLQKDKRIQTAKHIDIVTATNNGRFLQDYRDAGVKHCVFMPNMCDPDTDYRYEVTPDWKTDILWTGAIEHGANSDENIRRKVLERLEKQDKCRIYSCLGRPQIEGLAYLYAISGAKIGLSINAVNDVSMYHSDRLTHYLACGTFVLAKRVPDSERLFKDGVHLKYFDTVDEFFELANWYLKHEAQRQHIADAGMAYVHQELNCVQMAGYILNLLENGSYDAPWNRST